MGAMQAINIMNGNIHIPSDFPAPTCEIGGHSGQEGTFDRDRNNFWRVLPGSRWIEMTQTGTESSWIRFSQAYVAV